MAETKPGADRPWLTRPLDRDRLLAGLVAEQIGLKASKEPPAVLYHYTGAEGIRGILSDKRLFLTNSGYLNDQGEKSYPVKFATDAIREVKNLGSRPDREFWGYFEVACQAHFHMSHWFVGSLSRVGNQLSQWRAYTPHGGYSIGFDGGVLACHIPAAFGAVEYFKGRQMAEFRALAAMLRRHWNDGLDGANNDDEINQFNSVFFLVAAQVVGRMFVFWKSPAFEEEQEWRLVLPKWAGDISFHVRGDTLTPYFPHELPLVNDLLPLREIFVSPLGDSGLALESARMFTAKLGYPTDTQLVKPTEITLRSPRR